MLLQANSNVIVSLLCRWNEKESAHEGEVSVQPKMNFSV